MATNYPSSIDSYSRPDGSSTLAAAGHSDLHDDAFDAIEAIETELGTSPSGAASSVADRLAAIESDFQPLDSDLTAIAALTTTSFGRGLLALADAGATRTALDVYSTSEVDAAAAAAASAVVDAAPGTLDTLNELAEALGDDPNFATTMTNALAGKQPLDPNNVSGDGSILEVVKMTQAAYDAITPVATTLYIIEG